MLPTRYGACSGVITAGSGRGWSFLSLERAMPLHCEVIRGRIAAVCPAAPALARWPGWLSCELPGRGTDCGGLVATRLCEAVRCRTAGAGALAIARVCRRTPGQARSFTVQVVGRQRRSRRRRRARPCHPSSSRAGNYGRFPPADSPGSPCASAPATGRSARGRSRSARGAAKSTSPALGCHTNTISAWPLSRSTRRDARRSATGSPAGPVEGFPAFALNTLHGRVLAHNDRLHLVG